MMVPNKFGRIDRRCLAFVMSVVFTTVADTPINARPRNFTAPQPVTAEVPASPHNQQFAQALDGQQSVFVGHKGNINSVKFSPDGKYILTASDDNTARLWDKAGNSIVVFQHNDEVKSAVFSPDGTRVLTTIGHGSSLYLWDRQGKLLAPLRGGRITKFSPDSSLILTIDYANETGRLWDKQGKLLAELRHKGDIDIAEFSPDGKQILTASRDNTAQLWDIRGNPLVTLPHESRLMSAEFSPDGHSIITTAFRSHVAYLWDRQGKLIAKIENYSDSHGHAELDNARFSPDGRLIVTSSHRDIRRLWDGNGSYLGVIRGHTADINTTEFSPDSRYILTGSDDKTARLWDAKGKAVAVFQHEQPVQKAEFSPNGAYILTTSGSSWEDQTMQIWDRAGKLLAGFRRENKISGVEFSPDGNQIFTWGGDTARLWNIVTTLAAQPQQAEALSTFDQQVAQQNAQLTLLEHEQSVDSAEFSPDGNYILTRTFNGREPRLYDRRGKLLATLRGHEQAVDSAEFSPDSRQILTTSLDGTARLWDREGHSFTIYDLRENKPVRAQFSSNGQHILLAGGFTHLSYLLLDRQGKRIAEFQGHSATFSPDGNFVLTAEEKTAYLWDKKGNLITEFKGHKKRVHSPIFSPDGRYIFTAGFFEDARLWDRKANLLAKFRHEGEVTHVEFSPDDRHLLILSYHPLNNPGGSLSPNAELWTREGNTSTAVQLGRVTSAKFSPDGHHILITNLDNSARLVDKQGNLLTVFQHENRVERAKFSPDGNRVITTSQDNTARLWDKKGKLLAIFRGHKTVITSAVFSSDGRQIITVSRDNTARLWDAAEAIAAQAEQVTALQNSQTHLPVNNNQQADIVRQAVQLSQQGTLASRKLALQKLKDALKLYDANKNPAKAAEVLLYIGDIRANLGEFQAALNAYTEALPLARQAGAIAEQAAIFNSLGQLYKYLANPNAARDYYKQALPLWYQLNDKGRAAATLNNLGDLDMATGSDPNANPLKSYNQALPLAQSAGNKTVETAALMGIGSYYIASADWGSALNAYQQALIITRHLNDKIYESAILNQTGKIHAALGDKATALKHYNQALLISREVGNRLGEATTLSNMGIVYRHTKQPIEAIKYLEQSANLTLQLRSGIGRENRKTFLESKLGSAVGLIDLLINQNQPARAFEWANLATVADLADYSRLVDAKVANPEAQKAIDQWKQKNIQLQSLREDLQKNFSPEVSQQVNKLQEQLYKEAEEIRTRFTEIADLFETTPTDIAELKASISAGTTVIQPVLLTNVEKFPNTIALFVLTRDKLTVKKIPVDPAKFDVLITQTYEKLTNRHDSEYLDNLEQLYNLIIRPVEAEIQASKPKQLSFIATGKLRYIPFEALYDGKTDQYLIQKYPISYLTRLSTHSLQATTTPAVAKKVLAFGNPIPKPPLELKEAEAEVKNIMPIFPGSEVFINSEATLNTFKIQLPRFPILHLATHGCFQKGGCRNLGLEENTLLFADQRFNIRDAALLGLENTELITLSACQTGLQTESNGEEISGLAYLFERAGSKAVIASLWSADDKTTKEIMVQFYQNIKQGMNKDEALRQAKLSQIDSHPFFWSPFVLIGNGR
ncbi:CHAT domain-containing protein [Nostoc sp. CALU 546]|uniref:CHAT domain-containing protein n=1 Tax=Nostoc sp. CALU 546 TaxID=1867241 RepID=UPI003B67D2D6